MRANKKKTLDFEINLLPVISILAVCISFLLLTTVWVNIGTFDLSQAYGTEGAGTVKNPPSMWIHFENDGTVQITVKEAPRLSTKLLMSVIRNKNQHVNVDAVERVAENIKKHVPGLNVALLMPAPNSSYEDMVSVMDRLKKKNIQDIGIAPL